MDNTEYKRLAMGLVMLPPDKRVEEVSKLLDLLKCKHESDGMCYVSIPPKYKCKKCGEFYPCSSPLNN